MTVGELVHLLTSTDIPQDAPVRVKATLGTTEVWLEPIDVCSTPTDANGALAWDVDIGVEE